MEPIPLVDYEYEPLKSWASMTDVRVARIERHGTNDSIRFTVFYEFNYDYDNRLRGGYITVWSEPDELAAYTQFIAEMKRHGAHLAP
jgi:hypothetical protein